jgi:Right handed beta helix region
MTKQWLPILVSILAMNFINYSLAEAMDVYVSPLGKDTDAGTMTKPFKTIAHALEVVKSEIGSTIWLKAGVYNPDEILQLDGSFSGGEGKPLSIRGVEGEEVIFTRGAEIPAKLFKRVIDKTQLARLKSTSHGSVYVASLQGTEIDKYFTYRPDDQKNETYSMVSWKGYMLQQAQWPNRGYDYFSKTLAAGPTTRWLKVGEDPEAYSVEKPTGGRFSVRGKLNLEMVKKEFDRTKDISVYGYLSNDWFYQKENLGAVNTEDHSLQLLHHTRYGIGNDKLGLARRVRLINLLCELDEPGEWYYDCQEKLFFIWPVQKPTDENPLMIAGGRPFIEANGMHHLVLRNIIFENFGKNALLFQGCNHILVGGCTFRSGIGLGLLLVDGMYNTITGCDFYDLDRAFLLLGKYPSDSIGYQSHFMLDINNEYGRSGFSENRRNLIAEHNVASNNHIHHCRLRGYGLAAVGGVGAKFTNNLVDHLNGGIMYGHNDFLAEFNEFYEVGYEMGDWNVAYCGADLSLYNNMFRFNFAHHFMETPQGHPISAWRADDNASGLLTFGNIYYKVGRSAVQGGGPGHSIENSVSLETPHLWWTIQTPYKEVSMAQALREKYDHYLQTNKEIEAGTKSKFDKDNIIGRAEMVFGKKGWENNKVWMERYPYLPKIFGDFMNASANPWLQAFNSIQKNYSDYPTYQTFHIHGNNKLNSFEAQKNFLPSTMIFELPMKLEKEAMFVAPDKMDFRMRDDFVPAAGFVKIPFERIGLYLDEYRKEMPDKTLYRVAVMNKYKGIPNAGSGFDLDKINDRYSSPEYLKLIDEKVK